MTSDLEIAERYVSATRPFVARALTYAHAELVRRRFMWAMVALVAGVAIASTGAGIFASAETSKEAETASAAAAKATAAASPLAGVVGQPVPGLLTIDNDAKDRFAEVFGPDCSLTALPVEILQRSESVTEILSLPTADCLAARANLRDGEGVIVSTRPVCSLPPRDEEPLEVAVVCS